MTWGQRARHVDEGLPEAERARLARLVSPDVPGRSRSAAPPHVRAALDLQHTAGNAAVVQLIRAARAGAGGGQVVAQRQDEDEEDAGQSWASDETSSSSYAGGEAGGEAAYGPPPPPDSGDAGGGGQSWASGEAEPAGGEEPATEPATGGGAGGGGSEWSGGGGGAEGGGGGGGAAPAGEAGARRRRGRRLVVVAVRGGEETPGQEAPGGGGGGSSWWPFGGGDEAPAGGEEPGQGEAGDHSADEQQAKMDEGEIGVVSDPFVPTSGSPVHGASGDRSGAGGFHDGGRRGTVPFRAETAAGSRGRGLPHAITTGGKTGTRVWGGGGGAGPKGNQHTGTFSKQVEPKYDTDWGGIATNASAWVIAGTGIFDVHRDYMTSDAGDQGNGWWVSPLAASALEAHEQRHLQAARDVYSSTIDPMLDRISKSKSVGYRTDYRSVNAVALLQKYVGWKSSIDRFSEQDAQWNADQGQIDQEDLASTRYPVPMKGPKTIEGKEYQAYEIMQGEKPT